MRVEKTNLQIFGSTKQSTLKKLVHATKKSTNLKVIKTYSQYLEVYGLKNKIKKQS